MWRSIIAAVDFLGTDAEGHVTTTRYWPDNQVWKVIDAQGNHAVVNRYYSDGSLKDVNDAKGNLTQYEYNGFKGLKKTTYPDDANSYEEPTYDWYRRVTQVQGRSGQTIQFAYDNLSRVVTKTVKNSRGDTVNTITYEYDLLGRLYRTTDNSGTTKNTYDKAGRLIRVQYPGSKTVSYQYDAAGNRTRLTYPDGSYITYDYDQLNRLTYVRNSSGTALASYTYDSRSRRTALDYANGAGADYSYDAASRLLSVDNQTANGQHKYAYTYDSVGNRQDMTVTNSGGVRKHLYSYDDIYQITEVNYPPELSYLATDTTFNYAAAGNRTSVIDGSGTCNYTSNNLNQYTAAGTTSFYYDASGNLFRDGNYWYDYDPENRLIQVKRPDPPKQYLNSFAAYTKGGDAPWVTDSYGFAKSGAIWNNGDSHAVYRTCRDPM